MEIAKHFFTIYISVFIVFLAFKAVLTKLKNDKKFYTAYSYLVLDILFFAIASLLIQNIVYDFEIPKLLNIYIHSNINGSLNLTLLFILSNIIVLLYFFLRFKLPGKAWELVLTNKHSKNLDTFMVVIGLIFASAFGAITSFDIDTSYFNNSVLTISVFFIFIGINIVIMAILVLLSTYVINTMGNRKPIMFMIVFILGVSLLTQETLNFHSAHKKYLETKKTDKLNENKK